MLCTDATQKVELVGCGVYPSKEADPDHGTWVVIEPANVCACLKREYLLFGTISTLEASRMAGPSDWDTPHIRDEVNCWCGVCTWHQTHSPRLLSCRCPRPCLCLRLCPSQRLRLCPQPCPRLRACPCLWPQCPCFLVVCVGVCDRVGGVLDGISPRALVPVSVLLPVPVVCYLDI